MEDNKFTATCRVESVFPDENGDFTDLHLHNESTDKRYKVRAWHNVITPRLKVGEQAKFTIERKLKEYNGKQTTFFNLVNLDIPDIDVNDDSPTPAPQGDSRTNSILLQVGGKLAVQEVKVHNLDTMTNAEIHAYAQSLARSWFTMLKEEGK